MSDCDGLSSLSKSPILSWYTVRELSVSKKALLRPERVKAHVRANAKQNVVSELHRPESPRDKPAQLSSWLEFQIRAHEQPRRIGDSVSRVERKPLLAECPATEVIRKQPSVVDLQKRQRLARC